MDLSTVWEYVISQQNQLSTIHGPKHWENVKKNGLYLAKHYNVSNVVIELFAIFHDSQRVNDGKDDAHGLRGAELALTYLSGTNLINEQELDLLYYACAHHTDKKHTNNLAIACCWDADRLDLGRVGVKINHDFLNTELSKSMIKNHIPHLEP